MSEPELYKYVLVHGGKLISPREGYLLQVVEVQILPEKKHV